MTNERAQTVIPADRLEAYYRRAKHKFSCLSMKVIQR